MNATLPSAPMPACVHVNVEVLGTSGKAVYLRCDCGLLLVLQDGRMWSFGMAVN